MQPVERPGGGVAGESPFRRLATLIAGIEPGKSPIDLSIGEPRHAMPDFIAGTLARHTAEFSRYPPILGTEEFRTTVAGWLDRRYGLGEAVDPARHITILAGSREGLFSAAITARDRAAERIRANGARPAILLPNPFYHAYAAAAHTLELEPVFIESGPDTGYLPDPDTLSPDLLDRLVAAYIASPVAPQGTVAGADFWAAMIGLARKHGFMLFADECYSEIFRETPPPGALQAANDLGGDFANLMVFNSLSKRSNLAGLRCGFAAGDPGFLTEWTRLRNMSAPQVPLPLQAVGAAAYGFEAHVIDNRQLYNEKFNAAAEILQGRFGATTPAGGFFLWLDMEAVGGGEEAALRLWREAGVRTVPGGYLSGTLADGSNPGARYLRLALVETKSRVEEALSRIKELFG
ncbi:aspartate/methionine/tyrosine aminotransferase [Rhodobium orientis]|uniref:Aspartate aminotransferase n=1 Tax=Rhodobium orientis TaxID=34017 RepID=A0A327JJS7_9HYPH|nr:aminotransferase class I/II-fold pyridoxal phosphate-dependent enzyme [Rhodobium orientis]MBB4305207.1 aspartate/methionine/tyrosine aminotransferase [Rhodobium orientis]MBK5948690.1 aspartate aminotransferase [Rhodobium orientis]RAI26690.1 aspartate aminotransferase [Rhodobium orientis]